MSGGHPYKMAHKPITATVTIAEHARAAIAAREIGQTPSSYARIAILEKLARDAAPLQPAE